MRPTSDIGEGRSTKDAMRKVWKEIRGGREWIVDADLKDFLDRVPYCPLVTERVVAAGRPL